jgi:hypothetical protein
VNRLVLLLMVAAVVAVVTLLSAAPAFAKRGLLGGLIGQQSVQPSAEQSVQPSGLLGGQSVQHSDEHSVQHHSSPSELSELLDGQQQVAGMSPPA